MFRLFAALVLTTMVIATVNACSTTQTAKLSADAQKAMDAACTVAPHAQVGLAVAATIVNSPSLVPAGTDQAKAALAAQTAQEAIAYLAAYCASRQAGTAVPAAPAAAPAKP